MAEKRPGYSLTEVVIIVLILGALTFIAVPRLDFAALHRQQAHTVAKLIVTDLRRTRNLAIVNAATSSAGYRLQMTGSSPYTGYQIVDVNSGAVIDSQTIDSHITCQGNSQFTFGPLGNILVGSGTSLSVSGEGKTYTISVIPATGIIKCTN